MADEALARAGLHFDELNKIRVLEPDVAQQTVELKEECKDFVDSMHIGIIYFVLFGNVVVVVVRILLLSPSSL